MSDEMRLIQNNMQVIEELHHKIMALEVGSARQTEVLKEWIDWTLESFEIGVNDEYLEKLKQIKKKLSSASGGDVMFTCGHCGKPFKTYHDGEGYNTGFCPTCKNLQDTVGLDEKPPEPNPYDNFPNMTAEYWEHEYLTIKDVDIPKLIAEFLKDIDKILGENDDNEIYFIPDLKKKWEARSK